MRNAAKSAHVKGDYLNRLAAIWYRLDTINRCCARFDRAAAPSSAVGALFEREERLRALA
jgi:hypothetical protein